MENDAVIEVRGLTKKYKEVLAVNNLDLNVYEGDVFGFLGPNGAGKSTTIRMLLTLIKPTAGEIKIFGKQLYKHREEILKNVGAIVEKPDFYLYLSAYKNLEILGKLSGADTSKKHIMELLELVGLEKRYKSKVKTFSHGMKQRLGIAQALLHNPKLIILDEPTTGLDPQGIKEIRDLIIMLSKEQKKTILLSSHILKEVEIIANRMIIINKGATQIEGYVKDLLSKDALTTEIEVNDTDKAIQIINNSGLEIKIKSFSNNLIMLDMKPENISNLNRLLVNNEIEVTGIVKSRSLEEYFLKITEAK
ncbi:MAG TPA: ABC transporter ATP-binding protein [Melioribacteraceae bacterium]|nr:ABC transporter ATP-binding protein [Melioribacteraceae bacterium]